MIKKITFSEALKKIHDRENCNVLIGNGFSIACNQEAFSYKAIHEVASSNGLDKKMKRLFKALNTKDFEKIIKEIEDTARLVKVYSRDYQSLAQELKEHASNLKRILVEAIALNHPKFSKEIWNERYDSCSSFLNNFKQMFTTNYDLLLYWTFLNSRGPLNFDDGFRKYLGYLKWFKRSSQNIFYMHGALHLYQNYGHINKLAHSLTGEPLVNQIHQALENYEYPIIVTGGNSEEKLDGIYSNDYLRYCYERFSQLSGTLFIFGFSMSDNDDHLLKAIEASKIKQLFISIYGDEDSPENTNIIAKTEFLKLRRGSRRPIEIDYYDAESAKVWD